MTNEQFQTAPQGTAVQNRQITGTIYSKDFDSMKVLVTVATPLRRRGQRARINFANIDIVPSKLSVEPMSVIDDVEIFNICDLIADDLSYDDATAVVKVFCDEFAASYYADSKEDFSMHAAVALAKKEGKTRVVVEDLS